ncbi:AMP-binding protein [Yinghuangia aomiensis]
MAPGPSSPAKPAPTPPPPPFRTAKLPSATGSWTSAATCSRHALAAQGVGPGDAVALLLDRSADLVAAVLAIVKAGAAYVPLGPRFPSQRVGVDHAARPAHGCSSPRTSSAPWKTRPAAPAHRPPQPRHPPGTRNPPRTSCCTSGSTGEPKGITVTHHDVAALALAPTWRGGAHERVLLYAPTAFDASTYEMWAPLLGGGTIVVAPPGHLDAGRPARRRAPPPGHRTVADRRTVPDRRRTPPGCFTGVAEGGRAATSSRPGRSPAS